MSEIATVLREAKLEGDNRSVLEQVRTVLNGKMNNRLESFADFADGGRVCHTMYSDQVHFALQDISALDGKNIDLWLAHWMLYALMEKTDARRVWSHLLNTHPDQHKIWKTFFPHDGCVTAGTSPVVLQSMLAELVTDPELMEAITDQFPFEPIWQDYLDGVDPLSPESYCQTDLADPDVETIAKDRIRASLARFA